MVQSTSSIRRAGRVASWFAASAMVAACGSSTESPANSGVGGGGGAPPTGSTNSSTSTGSVESSTTSVGNGTTGAGVTTGAGATTGAGVDDRRRRHFHGLVEQRCDRGLNWLGRQQRSVVAHDLGADSLSLDDWRLHRTLPTFCQSGRRGRLRHRRRELHRGRRGGDSRRGRHRRLLRRRRYAGERPLRLQPVSFVRRRARWCRGGRARTGCW